MMRLSIQRLRWVLLAGALLLVVVLAVYIGYGRYRAVSLYQRLIQHSGATITHDTNGFTYSQSVQGKTIFTLHAKKATQIGDGKWQLHDAALTLYGRVSDKPDHIYGSEIEYDEKDGVARAVGDVLMDLEAPSALTGNHAAANEEPAEDRVIHVKTSGLVYMKKLGVAATDKQVELHYNGMQCTAQGAEFNTGNNILRLLADVKMDSTTHDQPVQLTALHAEIDRNENVATLAHPMVRSEGRMGRADTGLVNFDTDGTIQRIRGMGNVVMNEGTRQIAAASVDATLNDDMQLKAAHLAGGVAWIDADPLRSVKVNMTASGGAQVGVVDRRGTAGGLHRMLEGSQIVASFAPGAKASAKGTVQLSAVHVVGAARASSESVVGASKDAAGRMPGVKNTEVAADDLQVRFVAGADGQAQPKQLIGAGHTLLQVDAPSSEQQTSTGDTLDVAFASQPGAKGALAVSEAVQSGHVVIHDQAATNAAGQVGAISSATAERAVYAGAAERLVLTGEVHWSNESAQVIAPTVTVNQMTQDAEAEGGVQATLLGSTSVTHILATNAQLHHATQLSEFRGTDTQPAKMWQEASQVQAATLLFDGAKRTFSARPVAAGGLVHAVLVGRPAAPKAGVAERAASVVRLASPKMDYNDLQHEATFSGGVTIDGSMGQVRGERSAVFLTSTTKAAAAPVKTAAPPSPFSGSLDRVIVLGDVVMTQPGRKGTGDELLYTAASGNYVLTGTSAKPPVIVDAQQGSVTGTTLLFSEAGSTIVVAGAPGTGKPGGRVRTETEVRP
jgi:lipopolysaccharide export system protein LptA